MDPAAEPAAKKRRKGQKKRIEEAEKTYNPQLPPSSLATQLLKDWAWGRCTLQYAQQTAKNALTDLQFFDGTLPDLAVLSGLGSSGKHSNNMHRDIMRHISSSLPQPHLVTWHFWQVLLILFLFHFDFLYILQAYRFQVEIPFKVTGPQERTIGLMLPHELFATMHPKYPHQFQQLMVPEGCEGLKAFWSKMKGHPGMAHHPILGVPSFEERMVPINVHGDCVPITGIGKVWSKNLLVLHWSSALCKGNSKDMCLLIYTAAGANKWKSFWLVYW